MISNEDWASIQRDLGTPTATKPVPPERYNQWAEVFPPLLLRFWETYGFAGFLDGRYWLCDPVEWQPVVDAWTANLDLAMGTDTWHAIVRNAFGRMTLWGERTGRSLTIEPVFGHIYPTAASIEMMKTERDRNIQIMTGVSGRAIMRTDLLGSDEKPLFARALKKHGPVGPDTMYTFVPAYHLGGPLTVDHIEIADATTHIALLAQLSPHRTMGDITMS
ncbi:MAG: GAD-like domain-containing protein [Actinomycetia bacterium]|nr:GAD-like domain-containing protein [Actinomycetes bacterium]